MNTIKKETFGSGKKKLMASMLGAALVLSMGTAAYAANNDLFTGKVDIKVGESIVYEVVESGAIDNDNAVTIAVLAGGGSIVVTEGEDGRDTSLEAITVNVEVPVQK